MAATAVKLSVPVDLMLSLDGVTHAFASIHVADGNCTAKKHMAYGGQVCGSSLDLRVPSSTRCVVSCGVPAAAAGLSETFILLDDDVFLTAPWTLADLVGPDGGQILTGQCKALCNRLAVPQP
jgi:hypothetical protein